MPKNPEFSCADTSKIKAADLLLSALQQRQPMVVRYLRDSTVVTKRGASGSPATVTLAVHDDLVKALRGPTTEQRQVALLVVLPPPQEPRRIILPHEVEK